MKCGFRVSTAPTSGPNWRSTARSWWTIRIRQQKFFTRSDNYALAKDGIIAQTVSSYGLHKDYHQPTDTIDKIDFQHMDRAIASMIGPVTWLANTDFKPEWVDGKKP